MIRFEDTGGQVQRLLAYQIGDVLYAEAITAQRLRRHANAQLVRGKAVDVDHWYLRQGQQPIAIVFRQRLQFRRRQPGADGDVGNRDGTSELIDNRILGIVRKIDDTVHR